MYYWINNTNLERCLSTRKHRPTCNYWVDCAVNVRYYMYVYVSPMLGGLRKKMFRNKIPNYFYLG